MNLVTALAMLGCLALTVFLWLAGLWIGLKFAEWDQRKGGE